MRASLVGVFLVAGSWLVAGTVGCGDDSSRAGTGIITTSATGPGVTTTGTGGAGGGASGGGSPNAPCESPVQAPVEVYAAGTSYGLSQLVSVGSRWRAAGFAGTVTFDRDGANADATPLSLGNGTFHAIISEDSETVGYAASGSSYVGYQRFGPTDPLIGIRSLSSDETKGVTTGLAGTDSVVVWGRSGALYGRTVLASGTPGPDTFVVASGAYGTNVRLFAVNGDPNVNIFWYGSSVSGVFQSQVVQVDADGVGGTPNVFYSSPSAHELLAVRALDDGFVALVFDEGVTKLLRLDAFGNVVASSAALAGATNGYDMAVDGDRIAVTAARETGEPQLRLFDQDLEPQSPWVCFDDDHAGGTPVAVSPDGSGWAVLYEATDGAVMLGRVDATGIGAP